MFRLCRHPVLRWCYDVVFSVPFEYSIYMLILCNIFIIVLEFAPSLGQYEFEISVLNYLFFIGYALEATFKVGEEYREKGWADGERYGWMAG